MDFLKSLKNSEKHLKKTNVHDERISKQKKTYTKWVNNVLQDCESRHRVEELYNDLRSGIILSDIVYAFTGVKFKTTTPSSLDDKVVMSSNLSLVLEAMRNDGVDLVNNNVGDIIDGKPKIILGLVWQMILHYDIRRSIQHHQNLSFSDTDQSFSSYDNGSIKSNKSSPTSKIKSVIMSPINSLKKRKGKKKKTIERSQCNKIILSWLEKEICVPYGIKISNFSNDWKDGVAFMALIHKFCPSLVDMDTVKVSPPHVNISEAFKYASEFLNIKSILEVEDILCDSPEDSAITLYVSQFMGIDVLRVQGENKNDIKTDGEVQSVEKISLSNDSINGHEDSAVVVEKVVVREEDIEEEVTKRQFLLASGPLSTVSEESCEDVSMDNSYNGNTCKHMKDVVYGDSDVYPVEYVRGQDDVSTLSSMTNDSVFERNSFSKDAKSNKEEDLLTENNNLTSLDDCIESYDRGLENIFSSIFGDGTSQDDGNTNNFGDVESATSYVKQFTSSVGLGMVVCEDSSNISSSSSQSSDDDEDVIECCLDDMSPDRNKSFFDDSRESGSTSETVIQSTTSVNLDVVETVEHLIATVSLLLANKSTSGVVDKSTILIDNSNVNTNTLEIIENKEHFVEEDLENDRNIIVVDKLADVIKIEEQLNNNSMEDKNNDGIEDGLDKCQSIIEEDNNNFRLVPWLVKTMTEPIEKLYEIMNESTSREDVEDIDPPLRATGLQDCVAEQSMDIASEKPVGDATLDLNTSYSTVNRSSTVSDNVDSVEGLKGKNDLTVGSFLDEVDQVKELVENIASSVPLVPENYTDNYKLNNSINEEIVSLDFPEKTIEEQINDLTETVKTLYDVYTERLHEIEGNSDLDTNDDGISSNGIESFTDTESPDDEFEDLPPLTSEHIIEVCPEVGGDSITNDLLYKDTTVRRRCITTNDVDSENNLEGSITKEDNVITVSEIEEVQGTRYSYFYPKFLIFILILAFIAFIIYDCFTCSSICDSTSFTLCCGSFQMTLQKVRGGVPF
uniref:Calponin-homology (CH) domain-containing protein n=1 Tax=Strongyloides stercoralis TaxID=6248 RepID=A0A0K0E9S1_STRER